MAKSLTDRQADEIFTTILSMVQSSGMDPIEACRTTIKVTDMINRARIPRELFTTRGDSYPQWHQKLPNDRVVVKASSQESGEADRQPGYPK